MRLEGTCPEPFQGHTCSAGSPRGCVGKLKTGEEGEWGHGDTFVKKLVVNKELRNGEVGGEGVESRERCSVSLSGEKSVWLSVHGRAPGWGGQWVQSRRKGLDPGQEEATCLVTMEGRRARQVGEGVLPSENRVGCWHS